MKNKGFTLVEILAVIALMALVVVVVAINMVGTKTNTNEIELIRFKEKISNAGCQYVDRATLDDSEELKLSSSADCSSNNEDLVSREDCKSNAGGCYVCLKTLIEEGLISTDTINPYTEEKITSNDNIKVLVKWNTNADGTKEKVCSFLGEDDSSNTIPVNINKTLTYDSQGGSSCPSKTVKKGSSWGTLCSSTRSGYTFDGWYTELNGGGTKVTESTIADSNITVHAKWISDVTLTYDSQGGSSCPSKTVKYGRSLDDLCDTTKSGYEFSGWFTEKNGNGRRVTIYTVAWNDMTLYANWKLKEYTLYFNANGGTANEASRKLSVGHSYGTLPTATRSGYTFDGWYTSSTGGDKVSTVNVMGETDTTIYAHWKKNYTITYYSNYGSSCSSKTMPEGGTWGTLCSPTRTGYTFGGWYKNRTNFKDVITESTIVDSDLTVEAQWVSKNYNVTVYTEGCGQVSFNSIVNACNNSGTVSAGTKSIRFGADVTLSQIAGDGYYLASISCSDGYDVSAVNSDGRYIGISYSPYNDRYEYSYLHIINHDKDADGTCTVKFEPHEYTLTYNSTGGTSCSSKTGTYGDKWGTLCSPTRTGYTFKGWYTGTNGTGTRISSISKVTDNLTVYAKWNLANYDITLYNYSGNVGYTTATYGSSLPYVTPPSRTGYTFQGYYTGTNGTGIQYYDSNGYGLRDYDFTSDITLYAKWDVNYYYLNLNSSIYDTYPDTICDYAKVDVFINGTAYELGVCDFYMKFPYGTQYEFKLDKSCLWQDYSYYTGVESGSLKGTIGTSDVTVALSFYPYSVIHYNDINEYDFINDYGGTPYHSIIRVRCKGDACYCNNWRER